MSLERSDVVGEGAGEGVLYLVATPIGNLGDMTPRARAVLESADLIACEDTRTTRHLAQALGLNPRGEWVSYHEHNEAAAAPRLVERLLGGASVALASDAGTPACSDPGYRLVVAAAAAGVTITPLPGPVAFVCAWVASGLPTDRVYFAGFLPAKRGPRQQALGALKAQEATLAFYEAPHRVVELLEDVQSVLGARRVCVAREISKRFEELLRGEAGEVAQRLSARESVKGEVVVIVEGAPAALIETARAQELTALLKAQGVPPRAIKAIVAEHYGVAKKEIFAWLGAEDAP